MNRPAPPTIVMEAPPVMSGYDDLEVLEEETLVIATRATTREEGAKKDLARTHLAEPGIDGACFSKEIVFAREDMSLISAPVLRGNQLDCAAGVIIDNGSSIQISKKLWALLGVSFLCAVVATVALVRSKMKSGGAEGNTMVENKEQIAVPLGKAAPKAALDGPESEQARAELSTSDIKEGDIQPPPLRPEEKNVVESQAISLLVRGHQKEAMKLYQLLARDEVNGKYTGMVEILKQETGEVDAEKF